MKRSKRFRAVLYSSIIDGKLHLVLPRRNKILDNYLDFTFWIDFDRRNMVFKSCVLNSKHTLFKNIL